MINFKKILLGTAVISIACGSIVNIQQPAQANIFKKVRDGLKKVDPTNPNSKVREGLRDIDPTNPNSKTREGLRNIDPTNPNSAVREGLRKIDPTVEKTEGCGSGFTWYVTPNAPAGVGFKSACNNHDRCYDTYDPNNFSRSKCDKIFRSEMLQVCARKFNTIVERPLLAKCNTAANAYYKVVREFGGSAYNKAQNKAKSKLRKSGYNYHFTNNCSSPIRLAIRYKNTSGKWVTKGWWNFAARESAYLQSNGIRLASKNSIYYYYAEPTDNSGGFWGGNHKVRFNGKTLKMRQKQDKNGHNELSIRCNKAS
ncbi:MAG: phospholipase A2 [Rivularia sp. (in: cyanobacteria)]